MSQIDVARWREASPIAAVGVLAGANVLADGMSWERVQLASLCLLPGAMFHIALAVPAPSGLSRLFPGLWTSTYVLCTGLAAVGVRAYPRRPAMVDAVESSAVALAVAAGAAVVLRLGRATIQGKSTALGTAAIATLGLIGYLLNATSLLLGALSVAVLPILLFLGTTSSRAEAPEPLSLRLVPAELSLELVSRGMAHATIKPVTAVAQRLRLLSSTAPNPALRRELAEAAALMEQVRRVVRDVLDLGRAQAEPSKRQVNLARVVDQAVSDVRLRHPTATITTRASDYVSLADETAVRSMLVNIIENAVEASDERSPVLVELERGSDGDVTIRVVDRGSGFTDEMKNRIFTPFETNKPRGTGLGLTVAREVCRTHGGDLAVRSNRDGTVVEARLNNGDG